MTRSIPVELSRRRISNMGRRGINYITGVRTKISWIWRETACSDVGFDGEIEVVEGDQATGQIIKVRGKAGPSYIRNEKADGFDFYSDANHLEYWNGATNPSSSSFTSQNSKWRTGLT